jgi:hypothetical protein
MQTMEESSFIGLPNRKTILLPTLVSFFILPIIVDLNSCFMAQWWPWMQLSYWLPF